VDSLDDEIGTDLCLAEERIKSYLEGNTSLCKNEGDQK
jgi:hypothetical protein